MSKANGVSKKRQTEIPGTQPPDAVEAIDEAVEAIMSVEESLARVKAKVVTARAVLLGLMIEHKRSTYVYRDGTYKHTWTCKAERQLKHKQESEAKAEERKARKEGKAKADAKPESEPAA